MVMVADTANWSQESGLEGCDTVVIAFSAHGTPQGAFEFRGQLEGLSAGQILVNTPEKDCFLGGIPGYGSTMDETLETLRAKIGDAKVLTLGSGIGAYAAIYYGIKLKAARIMAFAPVLTLDTAMSPAIKICGDRISTAADTTLLPLIEAAGDTQFTFFAPEWDIYQLRWLSEVATYPNVEAFGLLNIDASVQKAHVGTSAYSRLFDRFVSGGRSRLSLPESGNMVNDPSLCEHLYNAKIAAMANDWTDALPHLQAVLEVEPDCEAALEQMGVYAATSKDIDSAIRHYASCCEINSVRAVYREKLLKYLSATKSKDEALWELAGGEMPTPDPKTISAKHRAQELMDARSFNDAIEAFKAAIDEEPENLGLRQQYAICLMRAGRLVDAGRVMRKVVEEDEHNPLFIHNMGVILLKSGDATRATAYLEAAFNSDPANPGFAHQYALALRVQGRSADALAPIQAAVTARPDNHGFQALMSEIALDVDDYALGRKAAEAAVELSPMNASYRSLFAKVLEAEGGQDDAIIDQLRQALTLDMGHPEYAERLAVVLERKGSTEEAKAVRQSAKRVKRGIFG